MELDDDLRRVAQKKMYRILYALFLFVILTVSAILVFDESFRGDLDSVLPFAAILLALTFGLIFVMLRWTERRGPWWLRISTVLGLPRSQRKALRKAMRSGRAVSQPELLSFVLPEAARAQKARWMLLWVSIVLVLQVPSLLLQDIAPKWLSFAFLGAASLNVGTTAYMFFLAYRARLSAAATKAANPHLEFVEPKGRSNLLIAVLMVPILLAAATSWLTLTRPKQKLPAGMTSVGLDELEEKLGRALIVPGQDLEARFINSWFVASSGPGRPFEGQEEGVLKYEWRDYSVGIRQGRPAIKWDFNQGLLPEGAKFLKLPDGEAILFPARSLRGPLGVAYRTFPDWLVEVTMGPTSRAPTKVEEFEPLIVGLRVRHRRPIP